MAGLIPCTCGCGREVSYATKQNHLNGRTMTSLRARMATESNSLKRNTRQQQKPTPLLLQKGLKKRDSSNADQDGSRKRHKAAQLEENQLPEITASSQVDTDLIEDLLPPVAADTDRQSRFMEKSRSVMEMRWTTSSRDGGSQSDGKGSGNGGRDEEDEDMDGEGDEDEDEEDNDGEDEDEDGQAPFYDSDIPGISNWDLLGEDFEREAAALGLYFSRMNYLPS